MAYPNQSNLAQNYTECAPSAENMGGVLNALNEYAKAARQRVREIEARLLGQPQTVGTAINQENNKPQAVQSVAEVIAETRALVGQTLDALDRIQAQL